MTDKSDAEFVGAFDVSGNKFVRFAILPCNEDNLESGQKCAARQEVSQYFQSVQFGLLIGQTYIDYDDVKTVQGLHVKHLLSQVSYRELDPFPEGGQNSIEIYDMIESRVTLEDSTFQIFTEPQELTLLNIDKHSKFDFAMPTEDNSPFTIWFHLGKQVSIEGRVVKSFP